MYQPELVTTERENKELERYLSSSIMEYGIEQMNGVKPIKAFCSLKCHNGTLVGGAMGYKALNLFFITHLYVEKQFRGKGYATKLLKGIETKAKQLGCDVLRLNTLNKCTRSLYSKSGFVVTASIPNYMNGFDLQYYHKNI